MMRLGRLSKVLPGAGLLVLLVLGMAGPSFANKKGKFLYVANFGGRSVSAYVIDATSGALTPVPGSPFAAVDTPIALAADPSDKFVYVANRDAGNISAYSIDRVTGALTPINGSPFRTAPGPISIAVEPAGKYAYVASECNNSVSCTNSVVSAYAIDAGSGALTPVPGSPFTARLGANSVAVDPSGKFAYVPEASEILAYVIDSTTGALSPVSGSPFAGGGTSLAVDPSGKFALVAPGVGSSGVAVYAIDSGSGALSAVPGSPFATGEPGFPETITVDPSGKFAYAVDDCSGAPFCLAGLVFAYAVDGNSGALTPVPGSPFKGGLLARSVVVDPSGKFVYTGSEHVSVSAYTVGIDTGTLTPVPGSPFAAGSFPGSLAIASQSTVPFANFDVEARIDLDRESSFEIEGRFTLGPDSNGINPLTEDVTLQVGSFSTTIPAGSLQVKHRRDDREEELSEDSAGNERRRTFQYEGHLNGVDLGVTITHVRRNRFRFTAGGKGHILAGITNPVTVGLTIGDDEGSTTVDADIDN
jgi:6-phosphogluconolactonase